MTMPILKKALLHSARSTVLAIGLLSVTSVNADTFNNTPQRIISTDAGNTELILALGLQPQLIAIDVTSPQPDKAKPLPNIGYHRNLSAEGLMSLNPDAIIGSTHMGPEHVVEQLKKTQINLVQLPAAHDSQQLKNNIQQLAQQLEQPEKGKQLLTQLEQQLTHLKKRSLTGQKAVFLLSMDNKLRIAGRKSGGGALISLMGAQNLADYDNYRSISAEALLTLQPSMIIIGARDQKKAVADLLASHPMLKHTPAGQQNQILAVDSSSLVSGGLSIAAVDEALRLANLVLGQPTLTAQHSAQNSTQSSNP